jgi:hypothetical protein
MIEKNFLEIDKNLRAILCLFLQKNTEISLEVLKSRDLGGLIDEFKGQYTNIANKVGWNSFYPNREPYSRAWLIMAARNRYYHGTCESEIDPITELADITNILEFVKAIGETLKSDPYYRDCIAFLELNTFRIYNNWHDEYKLPNTNSENKIQDDIPQNSPNGKRELVVKHNGKDIKECGIGIRKI